MYAQTLHRASWRGVPFAMDLGSTTVGRRKVQHDYPYRDSVWLEDQGKLPPTFRILGFLVGESAIYGGGDVQAQRRRMMGAAQTPGPGLLVHPSQGRITVDLLDLVITERWDEGNYFELAFTFVQGGTQLFPAVLGAVGNLVARAAGLADAAGLSAFSDLVAGPLQRNLAAASAIAATAGEWVDRISTFARDATSLYGTLSELGGADYGRYFNGRNAGFLSGLSSPYAGAASIDDLIVAGSERRGEVRAAGEAVAAAVAGLNVSTDVADVGRAVQAAVAALEASAANPADGVRILAELAQFQPLGAVAATTTGQATSDLFRRSAAAAVARMGAKYAPASADDAHAVRGAVLAPVEAAIRRAGATGSDEVFQALRGLRKAVVEDLGARGGSLARLTQIDLPAPLPAVVIAQRQYGDAGRAAELVTQADPAHPWFMPTRFRALAD